MPGQGGFPRDLKAHFNEILSRELSCTEKINKLRAYITTVQMLPYEVPSELQKVSDTQTNHYSVFLANSCLLDLANILTRILMFF